MIWHEILEYVEQFQTALVGAVGFAGVILTLIANDRLAASNRKRERSDRAKAIAVVVQAELEMLLAAILLAGEDTSEPDPYDGATKFPRLRVKYSEEVSKELGLLGPELTGKVMVALTTVDMLMAKASLIGIESDPEYITVPAKSVSVCKQMYRSHAKNFEEAIAALAKM